MTVVWEITHSLADESATAQTSMSKWRVEVAPVYRFNMNTRMTGSSHSQLSHGGIQPAQSIPEISEQAGVNTDDITQTGNRDFDDGFVHTDELTWVDGLTWYWGYNNNSQYDGQFLTYQRTAEQSVVEGVEYRRTVQTVLDKAVDLDEDFGGAGLKVETFYTLPQWSSVDMALMVGFRGFLGMNNSMTDSTFEQNIQERYDYYRDVTTITDTYTFEAGPVAPPAPYGGGWGGPVIVNRPNSTTRTSSTSREYIGRDVVSWKAKNQIDVDIDVNLLQVAFGGEFSFPLGSNVKLSLRPALLVNMIDTDADRYEDFLAIYSDGKTKSLGSWHDEESKTTIRAGVGLEANLTVNIKERWFAGISVGYEWIDNVDLTVGPNTVQIDLSALTASAIIGILF